MLTRDQVSQVKGMLARGDKQHDIAAHFGENAGRIAEINTGKAFRDVPPAPAESLPARRRSDGIFAAVGLIQGGVHRFVKDGFVSLTAGQMRAVVDHCIHEIQTEVRDPSTAAARNHIAVLRELMRRDGEWLEYEKLSFALLDGRLWLVDGMHRAIAQVEAEATILWTIRIYECSSEAELRSLFYKFNTNARARTSRQVLGAVGFAECHKLPREVANALFRAMPILVSRFGSTRTDQDYVRNNDYDRRLEMAKAYVKEAAAYAECIARADKKLKLKLLSAGVTAVALVTLRHQPAKAKEFWAGVGADDGLRKGDPRHTLVADLRDRVMNSGAANQSWAAPARAWNYWLRGKRLEQIKIVQGAPVQVGGTPFDGSRQA